MKRLLESYTFNPATKEILSEDFFNLRIENILLIVNVTTNTVLYNPISSGTGGTLTQTATGGVLSLALDTTIPPYNSGDSLQIWVDDGDSPAKDENLDTISYYVSAIHEKMPVCDTLDRALVVATQAGGWTVNANQGGTWNINAVSFLQNNAPTALAPYNWASGAYHIYNGIEVTNGS